jgi:hypothetical protein
MPLRLEAPWELLPADAAVAEVVDDPFLRPTIEPLVAAGVELTNAPTETVEAVVVLSFNRLPVGVAYDVFLRSGSTEWPAGRVCMPAGVYALQGNRAIVRGLADGPFDVVLRPNPAAAGESTDVLRVWNGELLLPNVLVTKRPFVPPFPPPYRASR